MCFLRIDYGIVGGTAYRHSQLVSCDISEPFHVTSVVIQSKRDTQLCYPISPNMDSSTVLFIVTLIVAFVFMRWLVSPVPQAITDNDVPSLNQLNRNSRASASGSRRNPREVTDSMIEVVQSIGPHLTPGQIRMDLERSGSVQATIDRYLEMGSLPIPPNERVAPVLVANTSAKSASEKAEPENLIEKFGLNDKVNEVNGEEIGNKWGTSKQERSSLLTKRREEMILKARKRLESQLKNEIDMPLR